MSNLSPAKKSFVSRNLVAILLIAFSVTATLSALGWLISRPRNNAPTETETHDKYFQR